MWLNVAIFYAKNSIRNVINTFVSTDSFATFFTKKILNDKSLRKKIFMRETLFNFNYSHYKTRIENILLKNTDCSIRVL